MAVLVIATLDTKVEDIAYLSGLIEQLGARCIVMDASTREGVEDLPAGVGLISRETVARAAGSSMETIAAMPRGDAVSAMRAGIETLCTGLAQRREIHGAVCVGGAGAHLAGPAFQALPLGFPKLVVSPLASGIRTFEPYVGLRDVAVLHSVVDIAGVNSVTSRVYRETAGYIVGAARACADNRTPDRFGPTIAFSMNGNTTPALVRAKDRLEQLSMSCVAFHANGVGGRALEGFIASGQAVGVLDYTTTELAARVVGGLMDPGPSRMEAAGRHGIPQVLVPGCVDFITCGRWEETERQFPDRPLFRHNPELTLVRLNRDEMRQMGELFAEKANLAAGSTVICVPTHGFSVPDTEGGAFWDPEADAIFTQTLRDRVNANVAVELVPAHVNDHAFVDVVVQRLVELIDSSTAPVAHANVHQLSPIKHPR
ncbi:MAG TPA: Tm-1-like ATP-binding domain-containing protein [Solirubrobacteraceae bacterium]|nr:Tm-1-like ATP-binding domain-containing protein [Solirubrobacteraceae bacterium]